MKKILSFCLLLLSISLSTVSCSKDDDQETTIVIPPAAPSIVGTWEFSKRGNIDANNVVTNLQDYYHPCTQKDYLSFTQNGVMTDRYYSDNCVDFENNEYQYTLTNSNLSFSNDFSVGSYTVLEISATTLKIRNPNSDGKAASGFYYELVRR